ncbi:MAG TPA: tetratricopeptide repeat protein [Puia sp.]|nr:tetratricopeptide repeat protein [Puia sp.]
MPVRMPFLVICLFVFLQTRNTAFTQTRQLSVGEWAKKLSDPADKENKWYYDLYPALIKLDSVSAFNFINQLGSDAEEKGNYFIARFNCIKVEMLYTKNLPGFPNAIGFSNEQVKKQIISLLEDAKQKSYELNDDYLAAFVSGVYGRYMAVFGETEAAVMYMMNCVDLFEKVQLSAECKIYVVLGEMLWRVREYEKCIKYTRKAIGLLQTLSDNDRKAYATFSSNTMALAFHRIGQYDSAFFYYNQGLIAAEKMDNGAIVWKGIISGNMAQIYFVQEKYNTALPLFELDYKISDSMGYYDNAANSLQWAARTNLALGKTDDALQQVREAFMLLQKAPSPNYSQNAYFTAAEIFKTLKNDDSSFYYSGLYNKLHDSLEKIIYQSSVSISKLRVEDEKNRYNIVNLQREEQAQLQKRNLIIVGIFFLAAIALLVINRQRLKLQYRQKLLEQDKQRVEQEMESSREQLKMFTKNIVEKINLIEKLEQRLKANENNTEEHQLINELSNQTILTEDDWIKFKMLFEKTHPGFFAKIKEQANDITLAEQRMAALTRLRLTTKQMAAVLGISSNSVIKGKQRLRQRFNFPSDSEMEEFVSRL